MTDDPTDENPTNESDDPDESYTESEIRTVAIAIISGVFFGGVATGVAFPILPLLDELLGITAVMLGLILSINRISRLFMNTPAGNVIDKFGARKPMIAGLFVQGLAPFGYVLGLMVPNGTFIVLPRIGSVSNPGFVFFLSRAIWGVGSAFVFLGAFATITYVTSNRNRGKWLGYMRGGQSLGFPTGLILGGIVTDILSPGIAFLLAGILALLAGAVAFVVLPDTQPETGQRARLRDIPQLVRERPQILPLGIGNMTIRFIFGGILMATVVKYADVYGIRLGVLTAAGISGIVLGVGVLASSATTVISGRLSDALSNRVWVTVPAFISMASGLTILAMMPTIEGLFLGTALIGVGTGGTGPALMAMLGDMTPGDQVGRLGGVYNVLGDVGLSAGPLLAIPMVTNWFGYQRSYMISAGAVLVTLLLVAIPLLRYEITIPIETKS
ncbi:MAG: MFS transporter [Halobacteriales archaeon]|nr:MFS transporter [Halobacteriales archaeon]